MAKGHDDYAASLVREARAEEARRSFRAGHRWSRDGTVGCAGDPPGPHVRLGPVRADGHAGTEDPAAAAAGSGGATAGGGAPRPGGDLDRAAGEPGRRRVL